MKIPFFNRVRTRQITVGTSHEAGLQARTVLERLLDEMPELLLACVVEVQSGRVLASYSREPYLNPNQISLRYAKLLQLTSKTVAAKQIPGGPLTESTVLLEDQFHTLRPMHQGQWYCFVAVRFADANLGMAWDILRRHTA
ncbi:MULTISPECIES: roadblock/LC7 domain-containing protein [Hymenobacter]|uniref:Roadblock/LAMTOR2 domain-containing protein n=2 Tax=Hymenobacter TaxID=89966 RepID=A0A4Z0MBB7_9BACT|nr:MULTISPECIES: hypothetical protein [Hymenobacter]TGD76784.1 hypothetical protein EU557_25090 [Hymenobacter wooponensis]SNS06542.1 hypothetical protein SAMN06269173_1234 [Hymenobacter mucosus]